VVIPQRLAAATLGARSAEEEAAMLLAGQLTPREREVLALLVEGATGGQISDSLTVSPNTVRTHIQNVLTKLQVRSRLEAAAFAVRWGIVPVGSERWSIRRRRNTQSDACPASFSVPRSVEASYR
jgi:DNA-binding NarL/FixJ family response regulator